jgi:CRISPR-associated protein Cas5t
VIGVRVTVPIASWRKGHAREFLETELIPPPATCYGALLSFVGERERARHSGCRVTAGSTGVPGLSTVLRTLWRIKDAGTSQGVGENAKPDFQQLLSGLDIVIFCDGGEEFGDGPSLEERIRATFQHPRDTERFGAWGLGESTHLINDAWLIASDEVPVGCSTFLCDPRGTLTLPVWVDHVGSGGSRYAVGELVPIHAYPDRERLPVIPLAEPSEGPRSRARKQ